MKNDLIERYIYAVTRRMNPKQREDVARELHGLVEDMLAERCGGMAPGEKDIRVVLTELGTPQELYRQYDENAEKCLIGQPYYSTYLFILKIVLASVFVGLTIANLILILLEPRDLLTAAAVWLNGLWNCGFGSFAAVTLLFAFLQRKGIRISETFSFDDLPPVPKHTQETSKWESIAGIGFCALFVVLFLVTPQVFSVLCDGMWYPIFDAETLRSAWWIIAAFAACGIVREAVQLLEGSYNKRVLTVSLITNGISAALAIWWLRGFRVLNPAFIGAVNSIFREDGEFIAGIFSRFDQFFLGCILFALLLDTIDAAVKTLRK